MNCNPYVLALEYIQSLADQFLLGCASPPWWGTLFQDAFSRPKDRVVCDFADSDVPADAGFGGDLLDYFLDRPLLLLLWVDTHAGLTLVYLGGAMGVNVWMTKNYFDTIPQSLEESAKIDGATPFQLFVKIILPLTRPILVVVFFLQFMSNYSEYVLARVLLATNENLTMAVGLQTFIQDQISQRWGVFSAAALIGAAPVLILFWVLQNQLVSGLTRGAVK